MTVGAAWALALAAASRMRANLSFMCGLRQVSFLQPRLSLTKPASSQRRLGPILNLLSMGPSLRWDDVKTCNFILYSAVSVPHTGQAALRATPMLVHSIA